MPLVSMHRAIAAVSLTILLSACGGGGSDGAPGPWVIPTNQASNHAPIANAGSPQSVFVGDTAALDGSRSTDADSDALVYKWQIVSKPAGSNAVLSNPNDVKPTFTADVAGDYDFQLIVSDGKQDSQPTMVKISAAVGNLAPVAHAGLAQNVFTGGLVTLNGSSSTDANGDTLTYAWTLTAPAGSIATLSNPSSATPTFTPDIAGSYVARLVVNDGRLSSAAATVTVTATVANVVPTSNAGPAQTVGLASVVTLNGAGSSDADGDTLTYLWSFNSKPGGSSAVLSSATAANPTFTADVAGSYVLQLIVNDGQASSTPSTVTITVNPPPTANAGADVTIPVYTWYALDASASAPAPGVSTPLTYAWSMIQDTAAYGYVPPLTAPGPMVEGTIPGGFTIWELKVCQGTLCSTDRVTLTFN